MFSPLSGYIGNGTYEIANNCLILCTDDGRYPYVFDVVEENLIYNEKDSEEFTWYCGLKDGSVMNLRQQFGGLKISSQHKGAGLNIF